jgi:hypothetical protein
MGVALFYFLALIPVAVGGVLWYFDKKIVWFEWLGGTAVAFLTAAIFHFCAVHGMMSDTETWSGYITKAVHFPRWVEEYQEMHTRTVGSGKNAHTETYWTTEHRTHSEHWTAYTQYDDHDIAPEFFEEITHNFRSLVTENGNKSGFYSGDPNVYVSYNQTGFIYPTTLSKHWENRLKAAPSVFSFVKVPTNVNVYAWPENPDWRVSERLMGTASALYNQLEFDRMNSRLGPSKKVNVIMVGFDGTADTSMADWQEAKWTGGRKNDLVICFGGQTRNKPATWSHVFGWSESFLAKRDIETLMLKYPASPQLMGLIEKEISTNYEIKNWHKFDYITVEPPTWCYTVFFIVLLVTQVILYFFLHNNNETKDDPFGERRGFYY